MQISRIWKTSFFSFLLSTLSFPVQLVLFAKSYNTIQSVALFKQVRVRRMHRSLCVAAVPRRFSFACSPYLTFKLAAMRFLPVLISLCAMGRQSIISIDLLARVAMQERVCREAGSPPSETLLVTQQVFQHH